MRSECKHYGCIDESVWYGSVHFWENYPISDKEPSNCRDFSKGTESEKIDHVRSCSRSYSSEGTKQTEATVQMEPACKVINIICLLAW